MIKDKLVKEDIKISEKFIQKFSEMYIAQRSETRFDYKMVDQSILFKKHGFNSETLKKIITQNSVAIDIKRESGKRPETIQDIYRSDLGELLLTYYFEKKLPEEERFIIPLKNISDRELAGSPGRGLDAIGYRELNNKIEILVGEAKVSEQKKNPPNVVDYNDDSIHKTQKKFKDNKKLLINRLSDYCRRLQGGDAEKIGLAIIYMNINRTQDYDILFGCALVRDHTCVKVNEDYGVFFTQTSDFDPHQVKFCIMNFNQTIQSTVDKFYNKVQNICANL